ncbi:hypothetical protein M513_03145 [Trichuris suis]|uniref:Uncharacterized protein n=1 Tax=Trichuris suis TaxID=68888 RepID=A0A085MFM5_9BILA|nr:hypothetical protein M513_03145 [Trichuris suis]
MSETSSYSSSASFSSESANQLTRNRPAGGDHELEKHVEEEEVELHEELTEVQNNEELKVNFKSGCREFWLQQETTQLHPQLWAVMNKPLIALSSLSPAVLWEFACSLFMEDCAVQMPTVSDFRKKKERIICFSSLWTQCGPRAQGYEEITE